MKIKLNGPKPKIKLTEKQLKPMMRWDFARRLLVELEAKYYKQMTKSDNKRGRYTSVKKVEDANNAGHPIHFRKCTLIIIEGNSAMSYPLKMVSMIKDGRDWFGIYPMRGKPLNVMNARAQQVVENKEIQELKDILKLREEVDYSLEENF